MSNLLGCYSGVDNNQIDHFPRIFVTSSKYLNRVNETYDRK